jgi:hypothetical protein
MMGSEWLYGAIALLVGVHVLTILYAYRRQGEPTGGTEQSDPESSASTGSDDDQEVVSCAHCGALNEHGYQFCRECVADLSTGSPQRHSRQQPRAH